MNRSKLWCFVISLAILVGVLACNQPHDTTSNSGPKKQSLPGSNQSNAVAMNSNVAPSESNPESNFMTEVASGGMAEVELGRLAQQKGQSADVKQFGEMMVVDHSRANEELKDLASRKNVSLPTTMGAEHMSAMQQLQSLSGAEFDKAYVEDMVDDHEADVQHFEEKAANAKDPDVKAFAEKTLPVLRRHLDKIKSIQAKMK